MTAHEKWKALKKRAIELQKEARKLNQEAEELGQEFYCQVCEEEAFTKSLPEGWGEGNCENFCCKEYGCPRHSEVEYFRCHKDY